MAAHTDFPGKASLAKKISAFEYGIYLLSMRLLTSGMLAQKLEKRGYSAKDIDAAILRLAELGYLNDLQFAQIYFENLKKYRAFGYFGIKKKLIDKKIAPELIQHLLRDFSLAEELAIAHKLVPRAVDNVSQKERDRLIRMLQTKGFRQGVIFKLVLQNY